MTDVSQLPERTLALGVDGILTVAKGKPYEPYARPGGYPIVYYTDASSTLCANCATAQELNNVGAEFLVEGESILACDVLEGSAIDHGIVQCGNCYKVLVDIDLDDEWQCECGSINDNDTMVCACGASKE